MKVLAAVFSSIGRPFKQHNSRVVVWMVGALVVLVAIYSTIFHELMESEGQRHSWATGVYWTLTVMSTLGFGDITFQSDAGRVFSVVVLVSGALFILVLLPFAFIQFVFMPWMDHREAARAPRKVRGDMTDHIVLTQLGAVSGALIRKATAANVPYVLVVADLTEALRLVDEGYDVMIGELDDPVTYRAARVQAASLVATTRADTTNTNIVFTVREMDATVPIVATASSPASLDILELAGCDTVLELGDMLGNALARRVLGGDNRAHVIGEFGELLVAEASVKGTDLVGHRLAEADLRSRYSVTVAGIWQRGEFHLPDPNAVIEESNVLILVGSADQLAAYDDEFGTEHNIDTPVVVIGGGRVGRAAADVLGRVGAKCRIVEEQPERIRDPELYVLGDAAEIAVLEAAGLPDATAVLITTHDDDVNVYLTIYCRRLRPDIQIIARANLDRNVATLNRAGADAVLSYASIGATAIWNTLGLNDSLVLAEGLEIFRTPVPTAMSGRTLADTDVRRATGCNVVAVVTDAETITNPDPATPIPPAAELVVIGDAEAQRQFLEAYPVQRPDR